MYAPQSIAAVGLPGSMVGVASLTEYGFGGLVGVAITFGILVLLLLLVVIARVLARRSLGN